jgi:hypothetical protein
MLRLDAGERRAREAAHHELAIDEERVGRAIDQHLVAGALEHHPRAADRPAQHLARMELVRDGNAGELYARARAVVFNRDRASVVDGDNPDHGRVGGQSKSKDEDDSFHSVVVDAEEGRRARGVWSAQDKRSGTFLATDFFMNPKLDELKTRVDTSMHANPLKWTGIATAAGLLLGLTGRILRIRAKHARPELVIIDAR